MYTVCVNYCLVMVLISTFLITNGVDHFFIFFEQVCAISCEIATIPPLVYNFQRTTLRKDSKRPACPVTVLQLLLDTQIFLSQPIFLSVINVEIKIGCSLSFLKHDRFSSLNTDKNYWDYLSYLISCFTAMCS